jgi:hypothetical protein
MYKFFTFLALYCLLLTLPSSAQTNKPVDTKKAVSLVQQHLGVLGMNSGSLEDVRVTYAYYDYLADAMMVSIIQTVNGTDVYNTDGTIAFRNDKYLTSSFKRVSGFEKHAAEQAKPGISALNAVQSVAAELGLTFTQPMNAALRQMDNGQEFEFGNGGVSLNNIKARLNWLPLESGAVLTWKVTLLELKQNASWSIHVDATSGKIIAKYNATTHERFERTSSPVRTYVYEVPEQNNSVSAPESGSVVATAKYNVIPYPFEDPNTGVPTVVTDPWTVNGNPNAYTNKWHTDGTSDYSTTRGNNVRAYEDIDANNQPGFSPNSTTALPNITLTTTPDFNSDPQEEIFNQSFAITNLFYWNNLMHDMAYNYGMDEVNRNFQSTNFGRGGLQNDQVLAEAQDGSGTDNANFAPSADGSSGRMQMFLWSPSFLKLLVWNQSPAIAGNMPSAESNVSTVNKVAQRGTQIGDVVWYTDLDNVNHRACDAGNNGTKLQGKIAFINRGGCNFSVKIKNAQNAGAKSVIVGDSLVVGSRLVVMTATPPDNTITIPAVFIRYEDAELVRAELNANILCNANINNAPRIDGDLDNGVVAHEYTHGISNRLVGNASCLNQGEQMGEGWSDYFSLMMTTNWATANTTDGALRRPIGNYAAGATPEYDGIRYYPYSTDFALDPWTYDSLKLSSVVKENQAILGGAICNDTAGTLYFVGELWCSTLWDMTWNLIGQKGINRNYFNNNDKEAGGNTIATNLVLKGMQLTVCNPGCVTGRDGILKADTLLYGGRYSSIIWASFAKRGLGQGANQGPSYCKIKDLTASYSAPLPVQWGQFTAVKEGNSAKLKWSTLQEQNADKFIIERSTDGGRTYSAINTVKAKGNSSVESFYQAADMSPAKAKNNYRIQQVDKDGKFTYSEVRMVDFASLKPYIEILPNPVTDNKLIIRIPGNDTNVALQLVSGTGVNMGTYVMSGETYTIDVSRLASGVYNLLITGEGYSAHYKVSVQK